MSAPVCSSQLQCKLNGIAGTAVAVSFVAIGYLVFEEVASGGGFGRLLWLLLVPMGPTLLSVGYAAVMRGRGQGFGWLGLGLAVGGAAWGVLVLNLVGRL